MAGGISDLSILNQTRREDPEQNAGWAQVGGAAAGGLNGPGTAGGQQAFAKGELMGSQTAEAMGRARLSVMDANARETSASFFEQHGAELGFSPNEVPMIVSSIRAGQMDPEKLANVTRLKQENNARDKLNDPNATPQEREMALSVLSPGENSPKWNPQGTATFQPTQAGGGTPGAPQPPTTPNTPLPGVQVSQAGVAANAAGTAEKQAQTAAAQQRGNQTNQMDPELAPIMARFVDANPNVAGNMRALTMGSGSLVAAAFMAEHGDADAKAYMTKKLGAAAPAPGAAAPAPGAPPAPPTGLQPAPGVSLKEQADTRHDFAAGVGGRQMTNLNTMYQHAKLFDQIADQLGNGNFKPTNAINVEWQRLFGGDAPTNLKVAGDFLGREAVRATVNSGAGTGQERELAVDANSSPAQLHGAANTLRSLVGGQAHSLDLRARRAGVDTSQFVDPEVADKYQLGSHAGKPAATGGAGDLQSAAQAELARRGITR